jgi:hypothetical protein
MSRQPATLVGLRGVLSLLFSFAIACSARVEAASTALPYGSFGPQVLAYEVLGFEWWQWQPHGDPRPRAYDIHVVVYCNLSTEQVARMYPVDPRTERDYRYITYDRALSYLDDNIRQDLEPSVEAELRATRKKLVERLPSCRR